MALTRREWLRAAATVGTASLAAGCTGRKQEPISGEAGDSLARFPGKVAMRVVNDRPPCLETPWDYYRHDLTPNEAFYVRWHLQALPASVDLTSWRLRVDGAVERPLELSMDDLRRLGNDEVVAVNQCSGNSRGLFHPNVAGRSGGMGRWEMHAGRESNSPRCCARPDCGATLFR